MSRETTTPAPRLRHGVAEEVRVLLARRRMSATKLAESLGWSQPYMARRMSGAQPFDVDDMERIAGALGVNVADLLPKAARQPTLTSVEASIDSPVVSGTMPHPRHSVLAGSVTLPTGVRRTAPVIR